MKDYKLIEGTFSDQEAKDIFKNFFESKIHFHEMKNFSSEERFGKKDAVAVKRIPELKKASKQIFELVQEAQQKNKKLQIKANIEVRLTED
jgi:hypothetical protein